MRALTRREFLERGVSFGASLGLLAACTAHRPAGRAKSAPGSGLTARYGVSGDEISLGNDAITAVWSVADATLRTRRISDHLNGITLSVPHSAFELALSDGTALSADTMRIVSGPTPAGLAVSPGASRLAERSPGKQVTIVLEDQARRVRVHWRAILRDGSPYLRQELTVEALGAPLPIREIVLLDLRAPGARVVGAVKGSPVVVGTWYLAFEHPLSSSTVTEDRVRCALARELPLRPGAPFGASSVVGITRPGQLRRDFLAYVERERAHPYRTFLHYNSWYDIGYFSKYNEAEALAVIEAYGTQLVRKRGVVLSSFLFDDGWDDPKTLWGFHAGFPDGFTRVREATAAFGSAPGVWMSPWGGYGDPKKDRLRYGAAQGFETNEGGFALSGPRYYERFRDTCLAMVRKYGVNQFKFDGTGNASRAFPGSLFDSDFDAAIHLIGDLRDETPDVYINLTTGTYPSPFWLRYADSIWRGGEDHDFAGVGSDRQQWMTYRDADTYRNVVQPGPLYPLSALMLHGLVYARHAHNLDTDPHHDFDAEIRSYFGTGTQLQEMYVTPALADAEWDMLAEAAQWSRRNAATLADTHWIGGDPAKLEVYGWASWSADRAIVTLRNPSDQPRRFAVDIAQAFDLSSDAPRAYEARSPWTRDRARAPVRLESGTDHAVDLAPFEVVTLEAAPL